jgi:hypothetical protein
MMTRQWTGKILSELREDLGFKGWMTQIFKQVEKSRRLPSRSPKKTRTQKTRRTILRTCYHAGCKRAKPKSRSSTIPFQPKSLAKITPKSRVITIL